MKEINITEELYDDYPGPVGCLDCDNEFKFETKVYEFSDSDLTLVRDYQEEPFINSQLLGRGYRSSTINFGDGKIIAVCGRCIECNSTDLMFDF